jgi:hypothetical protein
MQPLQWEGELTYRSSTVYGLVPVYFANREPKSEQASCAFGMQLIIPFHAHVA